MKPKRVRDPRKSRICLTRQEKIEIIREKERGVSGHILSARYNVDVSTISRFVQERDKILSMEGPGWIKKKAAQKYEKINNAVLEWLQESQEENITGNQIKAQARLIAEEMGEKDFVGSAGWLSKFVKRNNIKLFGNKREQPRDDESENETKDTIEESHEVNEVENVCHLCEKILIGTNFTDKSADFVEKLINKIFGIDVSFNFSRNFHLNFIKF